MTQTHTRQGHILLAHGSRDADWRRGLEAVAARLDQPHRPARCAYLELCTPTLQTTAEALMQRGCTQLVITPMFLGLGQHARHDIPQLAQQLQRDFPGITVQLRAALCDAPGFVDALTALIDPDTVG